VLRLIEKKTAKTILQERILLETGIWWGLFRWVLEKFD